MKTLICVLFVLALSACVQYPTRVTETVDDRPRLTFDPVALQENARQYEIRIDGVSYGPMNQYLVGKNTLPVLSGRHRVEVQQGGRTVVTQDVVLDANTTRTIRVVDR